MDESSTIQRDTVQGEERQLNGCWWAFLLLASCLLLQLMLNVYYSSVEPDEDQRVVRNPPLWTYFAGVGALGVPTIPAACLLAWNARSTRWRVAALSLLGVSLLDIGLQVFVAMSREPGAVLDRPEALLVRIVDQLSGLATWVELYLMAVLISEFALSGQANRLVERTESLGVCILAGFAAQLAFAGWVAPSVSYPFSLDDVSLLLLLARTVLFLIAVFWTMNLLSTAALVARVLVSRCRMLTAMPTE